MIFLCWGLGQVVVFWLQIIKYIMCLDNSKQCSCPHPMYFIENITNALVIFSSATNFIIYCIIRDRFRQALKRRILFVCCRFCLSVDTLRRLSSDVSSRSGSSNAVLRQSFRDGGGGGSIVRDNSLRDASSLRDGSWNCSELAALSSRSSPEAAGGGGPCRKLLASCHSGLAKLTSRLPVHRRRRSDASNAKNKWIAGSEDMAEYNIRTTTDYNTNNNTLTGIRPKDRKQLNNGSGTTCGGEVDEESNNDLELYRLKCDRNDNAGRNASLIAEQECCLSPICPPGIQPVRVSFDKTAEDSVL